MGSPMCSSGYVLLWASSPFPHKRKRLAQGVRIRTTVCRYPTWPPNNLNRRNSRPEEAGEVNKYCLSPLRNHHNRQRKKPKFHLSSFLGFLALFLNLPVSSEKFD